MTMRSVGFLLKTAGKAEVKNDFAEVRTAGAAAMVGVAEAAEDAARRATAANDDFTKRQIDGWKKQADAAKLAASRATARATFDEAATGRGNGSQFASVNFDRSTGAARASADVFAAAFAEEESAARATAVAEQEATRATAERAATIAKLRAAVEPAAVAQERYSQQLSQYDDLLRRGEISEDLHTAATRRAAEAYREVADAAVLAAERQQASWAAEAALARSQVAGQARFADASPALSGKSAAASAEVFEEAARAEEQLAAAALKLRAAIDPALAAQQRFDTEMTEARSLISQNAISLDDYCAKLRIEQATLDQASAAKGRMTSANGQARQSSIMLGQQLQDFSVQVVSGQSVATAFSQQIGQAAFAVQGMGGKLEGVANFLTTPWGIAATIGLTVLAPLVAKIVDGNDALDDAVDKLRKDAEASDVSRQAKLRFADSAEGVAAAIRDGTDATRKSIAAEKDSAEQDNITAKRLLAKQVLIRQMTLALLEQAGAEEEAARSAAGGAGVSTDVGSVFADRIADLQQRADAQRALIAEAQARVQETRIALAGEAAKRAVDPMERIKKTYDDQVIAANAKARAEGTVTAELTKQLATIERNREAAKKREQERQSAANAKPVHEFGREVSSAEASAIALRAGLQVNSADRSRKRQQDLYDDWIAAGRPKDNPVAKPGTSAHERGNALDIQMSAGVTVQKIRDAFASEGVKLTKVFAERGHWHVEWQRTAAMRQGDSEATKAAREAAAAERELGQDLAATVKSYDPARAAAEDYRASLAKIQTLVGAGKLSLEDALRYAGTARAQYLTGQNERFAEQFKSVFGAGDPLKDLIEEHDRDQAQRVGADNDAAAARVKVTTAAMNELRGAGTQMIDDVLDPSRWESWGDAGRAVINMVMSELLKLAVLNPLKNLLSGGGGGGDALPTITSVLGGLGGNATGTERWSGGLTWVNENGPEIADLPNGTRIYPAAETRRMMSAANDRMPPLQIDNSITIAGGAGPDQIAELRQMQEKRDRELPARVLEIYTDLKSRRMA